MAGALSFSLTDKTITVLFFSPGNNCPTKEEEERGTSEIRKHLCGSPRLSHTSETESCATDLKICLGQNTVRPYKICILLTLFLSCYDILNKIHYLFFLNDEVL